MFNTGKLKESLKLYRAVFTDPHCDEALVVTVVAPWRSPAVAEEYGRKYLETKGWTDLELLRVEDVDSVDVIAVIA